MEREEFEKLKKDGQITEDLNQSDIINNDKSDPEKTEKTNNPNGDSGSYSAATSIFDFSRDPDYRRNPTYKCRVFGEIVVEITVDINGKVTSANAITGDLDKDCLRQESESYARRWKFAAKFDAPKSEKGTITFKFLPQ